ncbi:MAG TPA: DUF6011 domain-containing protein [Pseudonocardiaceae bacterium]|nr:DUF6011 domain-containing protein [Pseudonocardiaceae bacterium]
MMQTTKCKRCGRKLTSQRSVARGYGRTCAAKVARIEAVIATYQPMQIDKALEAIEQTAIVPASDPARFVAVSSDGERNYIVDSALRMCSCPAGQHGRMCYHLAAADLLAAA